MIPLAFHGHNKPVTALRFNDEGDLLFTGSKDGTVCGYRTDGGERIGTYSGHKAILDIGVNHASTLMASAGMDFKTCIWEVETGKLLDTIDNGAIVRCTGFLHDDSKLFTVVDGIRGSYSSLSFYNIMPQLHHGQSAPGKYNPTIKWESPEKIMYAALGPTNDHMYLAFETGELCVLDIETQQEVCSSAPHREEVRRLQFDRTYHTIASASKDKTACLLDMRNLRTIQTYKSNVPVNDCAISPRADHVLLAGGTEAVDVTTTGGSDKFGVRFHHKVYGELLGEVFCHFGTMHRVLFHPSGKGFATGAEDGFAKLHMFENSYFRSPGADPIWIPAAERDEPEDDEEEEEDDYDDDEDEAAADEEEA